MSGTVTCRPRAASYRQATVATVMSGGGVYGLARQSASALLAGRSPFGPVQRPDGDEVLQGAELVHPGVDTETKLVPTWLIGSRDRRTAKRFLTDVSRRIPGEFQLITDAASFYREAAEDALGGQMAYVQIWKHSVPREEARDVREVKRVPIVVRGNPDRAHISMTYVERLNLTLCMGMRRYTRKTNAFSKKVWNHSCAVNLYMVHYNFCRPHRALAKAAHGKPTTPAMVADLADNPWSMEQLVGLFEAREDTATDVGRRRKDRRRRVP